MDKILKNSECAIEKKEKLVPETGTLRVFGRDFSVDLKYCRRACPVRDKASGMPDGRLWRPASNVACHQSNRSRRGQQILEYAIVIAAISVALMAMYMYTKRGLQAAIRDLADQEIGSQYDSQPMVGTTAHQNALGVSSTFTSDSMTVSKPYHEALYSSTSISASQGNSVTVVNRVD